MVAGFAGRKAQEDVLMPEAEGQLFRGDGWVYDQLRLGLRQEE
jgi:hypothetical protein